MPERNSKKSTSKPAKEIEDLVFCQGDGCGIAIRGDETVHFVGDKKLCIRCFDPAVEKARSKK